MTLSTTSLSDTGLGTATLGVPVGSVSAVTSAARPELLPGSITRFSEAGTVHTRERCGQLAAARLLRPKSRNLESLFALG
jgi:hypothetical protein